MLEGDPALHEFLEHVLERDGRSLQWVYEGAEALKRLRAEPYDLVVAAPATNGSDGVKLLRRVHALRPDTKVILTGDRNPARALAAIRARAYGYVHQPFSPLHLTEMVQQALDSASWRDDLQLISARPEWTTLNVRCRLHAAERALHLVRELMADLDGALAEDILAAFRELLMNGIEHGAGSDPNKRVRVAVLRLADRIMVYLRDPGKGFSLEEISHAAVCNPDDSPTRHIEIRAEHGQRPGGFGILMASNLVDELLYNERGNEVFFVKKLK
jgi:DNA-binding response OmpR family regulator